LRSRVTLLGFGAGRRKLELLPDVQNCRSQGTVYKVGMAEIDYGIGRFTLLCEIKLRKGGNLCPLKESTGSLKMMMLVIQPEDEKVRVLWAESNAWFLSQGTMSTDIAESSHAC